MSDVTIIDTVETAETNLGNKIDGLSGTIEGLPQEVQDQLTAFKATIDELKKNVEDTLAEVQETVENSPAGIPAPSMYSFSASSQEDGIKLTFRCNTLCFLNGNVTNSSYTKSDSYASLIKGVMVRYSNEDFPKTINDGELAFIDEDVKDVVGVSYSGGSSTGISYQSKEKNHVVVGLNQNEMYYFSAFPYSQNNVYNKVLGSTNTYKCQWTGTKGTLTVNVTQDYDYKPLGEYTATLTPTAGGQAITKTQSGATTIVFSGLEAGEYTLSFSNVASFTKPSNQSVTVVAGQSQTINAQYQLNVSLSSLSWAEIEEYSQEGMAQTLWSVGDTKDVSVGGETLTFSIIGFNHDDLADLSGKAKITFGMKNLMSQTRRMNAKSSNVVFINSELYKYVSTDLFSSFPQDLKSIIKPVNKKVRHNTNISTIDTETMSIFLLSRSEIWNTSGIDDEGNTYPIFTTNSSRIKKLNNGSGSSEYWWLRTPTSTAGYNYTLVGTDGKATYTDSVGESYGVCVGFCI